MQKRHSDKKTYFDEQVYTTENYVIPFIESVLPVNGSLSVFEIGCGEAGNLKPFLDLGCRCLGVDLGAHKIANGRRFFEGHPHTGNLTLEAEDIYNFTDFSVKYDIIMLRDVIEHIHDQERFIVFLQNFMHEKSVVFFAFPPWQNPFGGHQQICQSRFLSRLPFFHLLPKNAYRALLKRFGESEETIGGLMEIRQTGITTERFEKIVDAAGLQVLKAIPYFINPNYEVKFGLKPRRVFRSVAKIPRLQNYFTTCGYYLVGFSAPTL